MTEDSHCFWKCNWNWSGFRFLFDCLPKILADTTYSDCTHCWELGADEVSEGVVEIILCEWNSYGNDASKEAHSCHVSSGFTGNWLTHLLPSKSYCGVLINMLGFSCSSLIVEDEVWGVDLGSDCLHGTWMQHQEGHCLIYQGSDLLILFVFPREIISLQRRVLKLGQWCSQNFAWYIKFIHIVTLSLGPSLTL
jgi:hypothetical protein